MLLEYSPITKPKEIATQLCNLEPQKNAVKNHPGIDIIVKRSGSPKILINFRLSRSS